MFFCACVDPNDNELAVLEAIHLFVEILGAESGLQFAVHAFLSRLTRRPLDAFFQNVCELDLVFSFYKVGRLLLRILHDLIRLHLLT